VKQIKNQKNYATTPYIIYEYQDDTIQVSQSQDLFPPLRNVEIIDVIDIDHQPPIDMPDLINQDECSVSTDGAEPVCYQHDQEDDLPDFISQRPDDDSSAEYESEDAFSDTDDHNEDLILESAFGAQVTFIDDNNNMVTIGEEMNDHHKTNLASDALSRIELSNIATKNSHSETSDDETSLGPIGQPSVPDLLQEEDRKPAALPLWPMDNPVERMSVSLPPKIPNNTNNLANDDIMKWLERQNPRLADSFANNFKLYTTKPTRLHPKSQLVANGPVPHQIIPATTIQTIQLLHAL
jgi:hypothetical protein